MHFHSVHSDGSESVEKLAARVHQEGLSTVALTDHDTTTGCADLKHACDATVVRGVEISCNHDRQTVHLLAYDAAWREEWQQIEELLVAQRQRRRERAFKICDRLQSLGVAIDPQRLMTRVGEKVVGRPDIADLLIEMDVCSSRRDAFDRYLGDGGPADVPVQRLSVYDAVARASELGFRTSIAHPHQLRRHAEEIVAKAKDHGLGGLEVYYGPYDGKTRRRFRKLAMRFSLTPTIGSDFHNPEGGHSLGVHTEPDAQKRVTEWLLAA